MAEQEVLSKLNVLARASQRERCSLWIWWLWQCLLSKTASGTRLTYSLCSKILNTCRFLGRGVTCSSGGSDVNESEAKSNRKMSTCCCISERLFYSLLVSKQRALWKRYHCPQPSTSLNSSNLLLQLGVTSAQQPTLLLQVCSLAP